jgi:hypothetical protein
MCVFLAGISFDVSFDMLYPHCLCSNTTSNPFFKVGGLTISFQMYGGGASLKSSVICVYLAGIDLCRVIMRVLFSLFVIHKFPKVLRNNVVKYNMSCINVICVTNLLIISDSIL